MKLGLLHPGAMGVTVGEALRAGGHEVRWLTAGRSDATRQRAEAAGFTAADRLEGLLAGADGVVSVCPPHGALALARSVCQAGFDGIYLDANAVAPETARAVGSLVGERFVDGGIVGPPARKVGTTRLYLSGAQAREVAGWFAGTVLEADVVEGPPGAASALKMCYAAYTKGVSALLMNIRALAAAEGVDAGLLKEWSISQQELEARSEFAARGSGPKAWRFVGEMEEIAATFAAQGLPDDFHRGAANVYARLERFKNAETVTLADVVAALRETPPAP